MKTGTRVVLCWVVYPLLVHLILFANVFFLTRRRHNFFSCTTWTTEMSDSSDDEFDDLPTPDSPSSDASISFDYPDPGQDSGYPDYDPDGFGGWWTVAKNLPHHLRKAPPLEAASDSADSDSDFGFEENAETEEEIVKRERQEAEEKEKKAEEERQRKKKEEEERIQREKRLEQERLAKQQEEERLAKQQEQYNLQLITLVSAIEEMSKTQLLDQENLEMFENFITKEEVRIVVMVVFSLLLPSLLFKFVGASESSNSPCVF